jgi:hypothetical protein
MNVSQPLFYCQIIFNHVSFKLSKAFQKVMVDNGFPSGSFNTDDSDDLHLEFSSYEDLEEFFQAVCLAYDEQDDKTFCGNFRSIPDARKAMKELSLGNCCTFKTQSRFTGPSSFSRKETYIELIRSAEICAVRTDIKKTSIIVDEKVYTNTEEVPVYSSWYESIPHRMTVGFKVYTKVFVAKD